MKKKFALLIALTLIMSVFAACGSNMAGTNDVQSGENQGTSANQEQEKVKLHVVESRDSLVVRNFWDMFILDTR